MPSSKNTKVFILSLGFIENDVAMNLLLHNQATASDKNKPADWHRVPSICLLIDHPKLGRVLVDTGSNPKAMEGYWPEETCQRTPLIRTREDMLDYRLRELNISPKEIDLVILTHMHLDHAGGLCYFENTKAGEKVIVHEDELKQASYESVLSGGRLSEGYMLSDFFGLKGIKYDPIIDSTALADDLEIIWLPGHTPGITGILIHLEKTGTIFYTSDAVNSAANIYPETTLSASSYNSFQVMNSTNRIRWLQRRYNATLIYGHDMNQFKKLKLSPNQFYD